MFNAESLAEALEGCEAVVSCVGAPMSQAWPWCTVTLYSEGTRNVVEAMREKSVTRGIFMSSACSSCKSFAPISTRPKHLNSNSIYYNFSESIMPTQAQSMSVYVVYKQLLCIAGFKGLLDLGSLFKCIYCIVRRTLIKRSRGGLAGTTIATTKCLCLGPSIVINVIAMIVKYY